MDEGDRDDLGGARCPVSRGQVAQNTDEEISAGMLSLPFEELGVGDGE
jgi:hypothetical protein